MSIIFETTVLMLISLTKVLGLPHRGALWTDFRPSLNSLYHSLILKLLRYSFPKAFFGNTNVSSGVFSSRLQNSMQMCCLVIEFIVLQLEQHSVLCTLFLYQHVKTTLFIVLRSFWNGMMQETFLLPRILLLYIRWVVSHWLVVAWYVLHANTHSMQRM